jgi:hypothetical protein
MGSRAVPALLVLCTIALVACDNDGGVTVATRVPLAYTRFVNAVPDTGPTDWRFIDGIENSPVAFGLTFRQFTPYQGTSPGSRHLRVFPTNTDISVTSRFLVDTVLPFVDDTYYTIVDLGYADSTRGPKHRIAVIVDQMPTLDTVSIAVRAIHLAVGSGPIDVFASATGGAAPLPASPLLSAVAFGSASAYTAMGTGALDLRVASQGLRAPILADVAAPPGAPADVSQNLTAIGGSGIAKSVLSALYLPRSVAGTSAPQTAPFTVPTLVYLVDRHPR